MKNKKTLPVIILVFVLLIAGAYVLYDRLSSTMEPGSMTVYNAPASETPAPTAAPAPQGQTAQPDPTPVPDVPEEPEATERPLPPAPDFTAYDAEGNPVKLSSYFGEPIVLNFWASWCGPCQYEMPTFYEKYLETQGDIQFLMINMTDGGRETVDTAEAYLERNGYDFPVLYDITSEAAMMFGAYSMPCTFFIDADGNVVAYYFGPMNDALLQKGIDMIAE